MIGGTPANDTFDLTPSTNTNAIAVTVNGTALGTFTTSGQAQVFGNGGSGDILNLDDQADTLADLYLITASTVGRTNAATITYSGMKKLVLKGSSGTATITIVNTATTTPVTVTGGAGTTTLIGPNVTSTWTLTGANGGTVGNVTFSGVTNLVGGSGTDTFKFN